MFTLLRYLSFGLRVYAIVSLVFISSCSRKEEEKNPEPVLPASVTFAVFGNAGMAADGGEALLSLASALENFDADFAVDLGNKLPPVVSRSNVETLLEANHEHLRVFSIPVYPVVGTNDVFDYTSDITYSFLYGPMWYSFSRGGALFVVLNTGDESYRSKFGVSVSVGDEQLTWLGDTLNHVRENRTVVVFMNHPVWKDAPELWSRHLLPAFITGGVDLMISCREEGLYDWGTVDGIRAVSTGCTGPVEKSGIGLFPHLLLITLDGENSSFRVLTTDGKAAEGIDVDRNRGDMAADIVKSLKPPVLPSRTSWNVSESVDFKMSNLFDLPVYAGLEFTTYKNVKWTVTPSSLDFSLDVGETKTFHVAFKGKEPDLSPPPTYHLAVRVGETAVADFDGVLEREIPLPRMGGRIPIAAQIADTVPYAFDMKKLSVPVEISGLDKCGRLIIYREGESEIPVCLHVSALRDFSIGINEFTWNGCDLDGRAVLPDSLSYYVIIYNKKAPPTWVAEGPQSLYGTFAVEQKIGGLIAKTHTDKSLIRYRIAGSVGQPEAEHLHSLEELLEGLPITGVAYDGDDRVFVTTRMGLLCALVDGGKIRPDARFGENGYVRFDEYRGRRVGNPSLGNGIVHVGIGGCDGKPPAVLSFDGDTGESHGMIALGDFFDEQLNPPSVASSGRGVYISHPDGEYVIHMSNSGELLWLNEPGDRGGDRDVDGRSFTYGIGVDPFGFTYVNTPGTSARCGVLGPDGRNLFRVILVLLPGLRVSSAVPMIEGKSTDGIYFVTRGADKSYVFHVPYTVRAGKIVDEADFITQ